MALISNMNIVINIGITVSLAITFATTLKIFLQKKRKKHTKDKTAKRRKPTKDKKFSLKIKITF